MPIGLVNEIDVTTDGIFVVMEVTESSFVEGLEQEAIHGSIELLEL